MTIPVSVIGGYLGAGKTTLVNHLLRNAAGLRITVLVNDFGALPIDADLIEAQSEDLISLAGGCVCCAFGSDLMGALMQLPQRTPQPDAVVIETSGVALPGAVAGSVRLIADLAIDGVIVLVDAETVQARAADRFMGDTIMRQLQDADLVLVNKTDLVTANRLAGLREWLAGHAPRAGVIETQRSQVPIEVLFGGAARRTDDASPGLSTSGAIRPIDAAASLYASASFEIAQPVNMQALAAHLCAPEPGLLRAKGVLLDRDGTLKTLQIVGARSEITPFAGDPHVRTGLACIGAAGRLDRGAIERTLTLHEDAPAADRPA